MFYYAFIAFQAFCLFHVYKSRNESYWYFVIFFVPIIGGAVYFFKEVVSKRNLRNMGEKVTATIDPNKKIRDLEKRLVASNTFQNKVNLADAYRESKEFTKAILYYEKALQGKFKDHPQTLNDASKCYFKVENYSKVVAYIGKINLNQSFRGSIYIYAVSLEKCGYFEEAETQFRKNNIRYSNYVERLELSNFLIRRSKNKEAKIVLDEVVSEIDNMIEANQKKYRFIYKESVKLLNEI